MKRKSKRGAASCKVRVVPDVSCDTDITHVPNGRAPGGSAGESADSVAETSGLRSTNYHRRDSFQFGEWQRRDSSRVKKEGSSLGKTPCDDVCLAEADDEDTVACKQLVAAKKTLLVDGATGFKPPTSVPGYSHDFSSCRLPPQGYDCFRGAHVSETWTSPSLSSSDRIEKTSMITSENWPAPGTADGLGGVFSISNIETGSGDGGSEQSQKPVNWDFRFGGSATEQGPRVCNGRAESDLTNPRSRVASMHLVEPSSPAGSSLVHYFDNAVKGRGRRRRSGRLSKVQRRHVTAVDSHESKSEVAGDVVERQDLLSSKAVPDLNESEWNGESDIGKWKNTFQLVRDHAKHDKLVIGSNSWLRGSWPTPEGSAGSHAIALKKPDHEPFHSSNIGMLCDFGDLAKSVSGASFTEKSYTSTHLSSPRLLSEEPLSCMEVSKPCEKAGDGVSKKKKFHRHMKKGRDPNPTIGSEIQSLFFAFGNIKLSNQAAGRWSENGGCNSAFWPVSGSKTLQPKRQTNAPNLPTRISPRMQNRVTGNEPTKRIGSSDPSSIRSTEHDLRQDEVNSKDHLRCINVATSTTAVKVYSRCTQVSMKCQNCENQTSKKLTAEIGVQVNLIDLNGHPALDIGQTTAENPVQRKCLQQTESFEWSESINKINSDVNTRSKSIRKSRSSSRMVCSDNESWRADEFASSQDITKNEAVILSEPQAQISSRQVSDCCNSDSVDSLSHLKHFTEPSNLHPGVANKNPSALVLTQESLGSLDPKTQSIESSLHSSLTPRRSSRRRASCVSRYTDDPLFGLSEDVLDVGGRLVADSMPLDCIIPTSDELPQVLGASKTNRAVSLRNYRRRSPRLECASPKPESKPDLCSVPASGISSSVVDLPALDLPCLNSNPSPRPTGGEPIAIDSADTKASDSAHATSTSPVKNIELLQESLRNSGSDRGHISPSDFQAQFQCFLTMNTSDEIDDNSGEGIVPILSSSLKPNEGRAKNCEMQLRSENRNLFSEFQQENLDFKDVFARSKGDERVTVSLGIRNRRESSCVETDKNAAEDLVENVLPCVSKGPGKKRRSRRKSRVKSIKAKVSSEQSEIKPLSDAVSNVGRSPTHSLSSQMAAGSECSVMVDTLFPEDDKSKSVPRRARSRKGRGYRNRLTSCRKKKSAPQQQTESNVPDDEVTEAETEDYGLPVHFGEL